VPTIFNPPAAVVAVLTAISGMALGGLSPTLNGKFVLMIPHGYRARAYGVVQTGMQLSQFAGVMIGGVLANSYWLPVVVGLCSIVATGVLFALVTRWPAKEEFDEAIAYAAATMPPAVPAPAPPGDARSPIESYEPHHAATTPGETTAASKLSTYHPHHAATTSVTPEAP